MLKNGRIEPNKHLRRLFESELERLRSGEPAPEVASESMPAARVECEAKPIGHIPFEGRDWKMNVPVYAEESLNDAVLKAVDRLLCVARGGTAAPSSPDKSAAEAITAPKNGLEFTGNTTSDGKRP